jgi:hypothetical protein
MVDTPLSKPYWEPFLKHSIRCFKKQRFEKLEGVPIYKMTWNTKLLYVLAHEVNGVYEIMGWMLLGQRKGWEALEVAQSFLFEAFRGLGWGKLLYRTIINQENITLASGYQQSRTGRELWKRMVVSDEFTIWAHDFKDLNSYGPVIYDEDAKELWSPLQIYEKEWQPRLTRDVRLIAIKKED